MRKSCPKEEDTSVVYRSRGPAATPGPLPCADSRKRLPPPFVTATRSPSHFRVRGLRVVHQFVPGPLTALVLGVRGGARFDGKRPGLAHMAEHMLFQGTHLFDQRELNLRAAECGGNHNAETGYESLDLTFEVLNEDFDDALALLTEQFYATRVDPKRFAKERHVVLDEIRGYREDPLDYLHERAWRAFFEDPIGRPICGTLASVRSLEAADVSRFLRRVCVNRNAVLCVVGGIDEPALRRSLRRHVREDGGAPPLRGAGAGGRRSGAMTLRGGPRGQGYVARYVEVEPAPENILALEVALDLVGADADGALFQAVREDHGFGYEVGAEVECGVGWGAAILSASARPGRTDALARVMAEVLENSLRSGFDPADLARARKKRRYDRVSGAERRLDRAQALANCVMTGFPLPEEAARIVDSLDDRTILEAWRKALAGRSLVAVLTG